MNPLRGACAAAGRCTASAGAILLANATDQNVYTGAQRVQYGAAPPAPQGRLRGR